MRHYTVQLNGKRHEVTLLERRGTFVSFSVAGTEYEVDVVPTLTSSVAQAGAGDATGAAGGSGEIRAEMPGVVVSVAVKEGDEVEAGATLLVVEAMKMENNITAPIAGVVKSVAVSAGDELENDQLLVSLG